MFLTNASSRTAAQMADILCRGGITAMPSEIVTAGALLARRIKEIANSHTTVIRYGGGQGLADELEYAGLESVYLSDIHPNSVQGESCIIFGYTKDFTLVEAKVLLALASEVTTFLTAEKDRWYAGFDGPTPGVGWVVAAAENVLNRTAEIVGKPSGYGLKAIANDLAVPVQHILMVGDSFDADVMAARNAGAIACLAGQSMAHPLADLTIDSIAELPQIVSSWRIIDREGDRIEKGGTVLWVMSQPHTTSSLMQPQIGLSAA